MGTADTIQYVDGDDYSCSWVANSPNDFLYIKLADAAGKTYRFGFEEFTASDNLQNAKARNYEADDTYSNIVDENGPFDGAQEYEFTATPTCTSLSIMLGHRYTSEGITSPVIMTLKGIYIQEVDNTSYAALNFHKVLAENLPKEVPPGSEHVYYTTDGATVKMYISTKEGSLVPVEGSPSGSGGSSESVYTNAYTQQWIDERKEDIIKLQKKGHCITFAIATDIHVRKQDGNAGRYNQVRDFLMLAEQLPLDYVCCCGDIMTNYEQWDGVTEGRVETVRSIFSKLKVPWFSTRGNHDYNIDYSVGDLGAAEADAQLITNRDWYRMVISKLPLCPSIKICLDNEHPTQGYFYVDDSALKCRLVFFNTNEVHENEFGRPYVDQDGVAQYGIYGIATEHQMNWLINEALNMNGKSDWVVAFFSHYAPYTDKEEAEPNEFHGYGEDNPKMRQIIHAFQEGTSIIDLHYSVMDVSSHSWKEMIIAKDFTLQGPMQVIGWFSGHIHDDCYKKVDKIPILVSTCVCASQRTNWPLDENPIKLPPERNSSNLATSVNVIIVNKDTRTVNVIKVGSKRDNAVKTSSDLEWTY